MLMKHKRHPHRFQIFFSLLVSLTAANAFGLDLSGLSDEEKGLAIAVEADRRDVGFGDNVASMVMVLKNATGASSTRYLRVKTLEVDGDGDKSLSIFDKPADVKGTTMLTFSHGVKPDDQWLYLPAAKRVKRINSRNKSGPFMGSEFAFEDLSSQEVDKYQYRYLRDEVIDGKPTYVIERKPEYKFSGYTRQIVWLDQQEFFVVKTQYYDRKNALLKTLVASGYQQYLNKYWRADQMLMQNHVTKKSTLLTWSDYEFKTGLGNKDFNQNALKRVR